MSNRLCRRESGMTLMELVVAIVVIGVGLAGVLVAFNQAVMHSADPMVRKQMLAIAEEMMDEITLRQYVPIANLAPPVLCARSTFNDVLDYAGYSSTGICDIDGNAIPTLSTYDVSVSVMPGALPNGVAAKKIVVTVSHGAESLKLVGYRTDWAS